MDKIQFLIEKVRSFLIEAGEDVAPRKVYTHFSGECKSLGFTEQDFYEKVVKPASKGIDWKAIREGKVEEEKAAEREKERVERAARDIDRRIQIMFDDGIVEAAELKSVFAKAAQLSMDVESVAIKIDALLNERNYKSHRKANLDAPGLMEVLTSTDWYSPEAYKRYVTDPPVPPPPPPEKEKNKKPGWMFVAGGIALAALIYFISGPAGDKGKDTGTGGSDTVGYTDRTISVSDTSRRPGAPTDTASNESSTRADTTAQIVIPEPPNGVVRENIERRLKAFYQYENNGDIEEALNYFAFPLTKYYFQKCPCSRKSMYNLYYTAYNETFSYHHIIVDWSTLSFKRISSGYKVTLSLSYEFRMKTWTDDQPNLTKYPTVVIYMNNDYKIKSIYQL